MSFADAGLGLAGARLGAAAKPCDLVLDQVLQRFLPFALGVEELLFLFQEVGVAAAGAQESVGIDAAQFDHLGGHVLEEVTIVADDDGGEWRVLQQLFQPFNAGQVEMVGGLVEQQDVRLLHQRLGDGQSFSPSSGQVGSFLLEVLEAGAAERLAGARFPFRFRDLGLFKCGVNHVANGLAGRELGFLLQVAETGALAQRHFAAVGGHRGRRGFAGALTYPSRWGRSGRSGRVR